jgi:hypothetical protein
MKVDKGMTCGFEENIRRVLIDAEQKLIVDPKENIQKAKFLSRYEYRNFNDDIVELEYEYRGHKYTVEENRSKGNEPLSWQHRNAQARIDSMIEMEEREKECNTNTDNDDWLKMLWGWWEN